MLQLCQVSFSQSSFDIFATSKLDVDITLHLSRVEVEDAIRMANWNSFDTYSKNISRIDSLFIVVGANGWKVEELLEESHLF